MALSNATLSNGSASNGDSIEMVYCSGVISSFTDISLIASPTPST